MRQHKFKKKKNCVIVLNIILESLLKWFAPILVFTTEEIYSLVNKDNSESVHENNFVKIPANWNNEKLNEKGQIYLKLNKRLILQLKRKGLTKKLVQA